MSDTTIDNRALSNKNDRMSTTTGVSLPAESTRSGNDQQWKLLKRAGTLAIDESTSRSAASSMHIAYCKFSLHWQSVLKRELGPHADVDQVATMIEHRWRNELTFQERQYWIELTSCQSPSPSLMKEEEDASNEEDTSQSANSTFNISNNLHMNMDEKREDKDSRATITQEEGSSKKKVKIHSKKQQEISDQPEAKETKEKDSTGDQMNDSTTPSVESKPKRPMTAYLFFAHEMRPRIKQLHPAYPGIAVTRELGRIWSSLDFFARFKYKQLEFDARKDYIKQMKKWKNGGKDPEASSYSSHTTDTTPSFISTGSLSTESVRSLPAGSSGSFHLYHEPNQSIDAMSARSSYQNLDGMSARSFIDIDNQDH